MSRLNPINKCPKKMNVFHNMAFVIFCPKHQKIAVSDNFDEERELAVWLPFVYLSSDLKKRITVEESVSLILSGGDPELMAIYKKEQPYDSKVSLVTNTMIKENDFGFTRSFCLVRLHSDNPVLQCCRKTSRIIWLDIEEISNNDIHYLWGPQLKTYSKAFEKIFQRGFYHFFRTFFCIMPQLQFDQEILESLSITKKQIHLFYIDFIEHCFPSVYMSFMSFKDYLGKYGFKTSDKPLKRIYKAFMKDDLFTHHSEDDLLFEELLLGLAHIDPQSVFNNSRLAFVFRYYDFDGDGYLSKEELREMIEDIHEKETSDMIDSIVNDYWFIIRPSDRGIDYEQFLLSAYNQTILVPDFLRRFENRILLEIILTLETRNRGIVSRIKTFVSHYCRKIMNKN